MGLTAGQIAFNEIAVPIALAEPTPFGEAILGAINLGFLIYNNPPNLNRIYEMSASKNYPGLTGNQIISKFRKGSVRQEFPEEYGNKTWEEIVKEANSGIQKAKTAKKLLLDGRFAK